MFDSKLSKIAIIVFIISILLIYLNYKYNLELRKQIMEPVFIYKIRNSKKSEQYSGKRIVNPVIGFACTYSVWLFVSEWDYRKKEYKNIFHFGDAEGKTCNPGVWLTPNINNILVRFDNDVPDNKYIVNKGYGTYLQRKIKWHKYNSETIFVNQHELLNISNTKPKTYKEILIDYDSSDTIVLFMEKNISLLTVNHKK